MSRVGSFISLRHSLATQFIIYFLFLVIKVSARTHQAQLTKLDKSELLDHGKHGASH